MYLIRVSAIQCALRSAVIDKLSNVEEIKTVTTRKEDNLPSTYIVHEDDANSDDDEDSDDTDSSGDEEESNDLLGHNRKRDE